MNEQMQEKKKRAKKGNDNPTAAGVKETLRSYGIPAAIAAFVATIVTLLINASRALAAGWVIDLILVTGFFAAAANFMLAEEYILAFLTLALLALLYLAREQIRRGRQ